MAETLPPDPSLSPQESMPYIYPVPGERAETSPAYADTLVPLAPLDEAFLDYCGPAATNPNAAYSFIRDRVQTESSGRGTALFFPQALVAGKLQHKVIPTQSASLTHEQEDSRDQAIRKAVLHYPLPEISRAILLHQSLKKRGLAEEAGSVASVLEAFGLSIKEMGEDANIFRWAKDQVRRRHLARETSA